MNKLKNAGDAIKKKLSLQDYQTAEQHDNIPVSEQVAIPAQQQIDMAVKPHTDKTAKQHTISPAHHGTGKPSEQHGSITVNQHANETVHQQNNMLAKQPDGLSAEALAKEDKSMKKIKVTHYLSEEDNDRLTSMYIKRLQEKKKVDKSALISQAIQLLFKKENK